MTNEILYKSFRVQVKAVNEKGIFSAYASTFDNVDSYGDVVCKGAFKQTINLNRGLFPILADHDMTREVGMSTEAVEDDHGLLITGQLYLDDDPKNELPEARNMYIKMKRRAEIGKPMGMSIGYRVIKDDWEGQVRLLKEIQLLEMSFTAFPANDRAFVTAIKSGIPQQNNRINDLLAELIDMCDRKDMALNTSNRALLSVAAEKLHSLLQPTANVAAPANGSAAANAAAVKPNPVGDAPNVESLLKALQELSVRT